MDEKAQNLTVDLAKHLVTISLAAVGFVLAVMFTWVGDEPLGSSTLFKTSLALSLILFFLCVLFAVLTQVAVLGSVEGQRPTLIPIEAKTCLLLAWICLVSAIVALVVFAWANTFGSIPLGIR